jgi:TfoX/Sxy family transcriptional regulator of competence genes
MPFDEGLAQRIEEALPEGVRLERKKMFGGLAFLDRGNLVVGVSNDHLMVRVGKDAYEEALTQPGARVFDMTGKPMAGWILVEQKGYESDGDLNRWITQALDFVSTLPAK